jgi:hypothetical protein
MANPEANATDPPTAASNAIDEPFERVALGEMEVVVGVAVDVGAEGTVATMVTGVVAGGGNFESTASLVGGGKFVGVDVAGLVAGTGTSAGGTSTEVSGFGATGTGAGGAG